MSSNMSNDWWKRPGVGTLLGLSIYPVFTLYVNGKQAMVLIKIADSPSEMQYYDRGYGLVNVSGFSSTISMSSIIGRV